MAEKMLSLLRDDAQDIVVEVLQAASAEGFAPFTELPEQVRLRCLGSLIDVIAEYCQNSGASLTDNTPGTVLARMQALQDYADVEVRRHCALGIKLVDFLILLKHYRTIFRRHLEAQAGDDAEIARGLSMIEAMFDALEISSGGAWARQVYEDQGEAIQLREDFWLKVFSAIKDAVIIHDAATGKALYVNDAATRMYGADRKTLLNAKLGQYSAGGVEQDQTPMVKMVQSVRENGAQHFEWQARHHDGHLFWVDVSLSQMDIGEQSFVIAVARDIDRHKQDEQEKFDFNKKRHELRRLESLGLLAGGVAHDFNNLLTSIMGNAELMRMAPEASEDHRACLDSIEQASEKAAGLCQQMLHFAGTGLINKAAVSVVSVVEKALRELRKNRAADLSLIIDIEQGLPDIQVDREQLLHVVKNLLLNAVESIVDRDQSRIHLRACVRHCAERCFNTKNHHMHGGRAKHGPGDYLCIEVEDNGCGMSPEIREKIFEPFFSTKFFGRGLGLAAVAGIARSYHGFVEAHSKKGQGSTVAVYLPLAEVAPRYRPQQKKDQNTILLIDDDAEVRSVGERMLRMMHFEVLLAEDGEQGLHVFAEHRARICCVVTDLSMPVLNGVETIQKIYELAPQMPVVLMSGYDAPRAAAHFDEKITVKFVQKPFNYSTLKGVVELVTGRDTK